MIRERQTLTAGVVTDLVEMTDAAVWRSGIALAIVVAAIETRTGEIEMTEGVAVAEIEMIGIGIGEMMTEVAVITEIVTTGELETGATKSVTMTEVVTGSTEIATRTNQRLEIGKTEAVTMTAGSGSVKIGTAGVQATDLIASAVLDETQPASVIAPVVATMIASDEEAVATAIARKTMSEAVETSSDRNGRKKWVQHGMILLCFVKRMKVTAEENIVHPEPSYGDAMRLNSSGL